MNVRSPNHQQISMHDSISEQSHADTQDMEIGNALWKLQNLTLSPELHG